MLQEEVAILSRLTTCCISVRIVLRMPWIPFILQMIQYKAFENKEAIVSAEQKGWILNLCLDFLLLRG